jgi:hypothetical protein
MYNIITKFAITPRFSFVNNSCSNLDNTNVRLHICNPNWNNLPGIKVHRNSNCVRKIMARQNLIYLYQANKLTYF